MTNNKFKKYLIRLTLPETDNEIRMICESNSEQHVEQLSNNLADMMNPEEVFFDKSNRSSLTNWYGYSEEIK